MKRLATLTATAWLAACAPTSPDPANDAPAPAATASEPSIATDLAPYLAIDAWRAPDSNIVLSPFGIRQAFGLAHLGARGDSASEIEATFRLDPGEAAAKALSAQRTNLLDSGEGVRIRIANALWLSRDWRFRPAFVEDVRRHHDARVTALDFRGNRAQAAAAINAWSRESTEGLVPEVIGERDIDPDTAAFLTNAVFFEGDWSIPFIGGGERPFLHGDGRDRPFWFMERKGAHAMAERNGWRAIRLPYGPSGRFVMDVMLPVKRGPLPAGIPTGPVDALTAALDAAEPGPVRLFLPRFQIDFSADLRAPLMASGLRAPFDSARADLSGMAEPGQRRLFIDQVLHAARLQVYEQGTRAAAVTVMSIMPVSAPPPWTGPDFKVDHPFLFAIRDTESGTLLFFGRVADPQPYTPPPPVPPG